jgi:hypothetical protein
MKTLLLSGIIGIIAFIGFLFTPGTPVPGAEVIIEQEGNRTPVAFHQTGNNGKVTFAHLPGGLYRIKITLPQQSGKLMRGRDNINCKLQVGYHNGKKQYFLREPEGFFTIKYSKIRRLANRNITPVYHLETGDRNKQFERGNRSRQLEIGKVEVTGNNGSFTMELRAQRPKRFEKMVEKVIDDVEMITIRNTR